MSDSPLFAGRSAIVALFSVAGCALVAAVTLTAVGISADVPESCCEGESQPVVSEQAAAKAAANRPAGLPMCLIGTWRSVAENTMFKFYSDQPASPFTGSGRQVEFRPDGTGSERRDNFTLTGSFGSRALRLVSNGSVEFKWSANDQAITYIGHTSATITYYFYDHRGLIESQPFKLNPALNEVDQYTCQPSQLTESGSTGYRSVWVRTAGAGVYG
ncbi:MAG: hypothetical protein ABW224_24625 [Kibdelosporangium sp.]